MALLLLRNEADCLVPDMKTELVSSRVPPELSRSHLPRELCRPATLKRHTAFFVADVRTRAIHRAYASESGNRKSDTRAASGGSFRAYYPRFVLDIASYRRGTKRGAPN